MIIDMQKEHYLKLGIRKRAFTPKPRNEAAYAEMENRIGAALQGRPADAGQESRGSRGRKILADQLAGIPEEDADRKAEAKRTVRAPPGKDRPPPDPRRGPSAWTAEASTTSGRSPSRSAPFPGPTARPSSPGARPSALATVTLGTTEDAQRIDGLGEETQKRFMLHYNFPAFSGGRSRLHAGPRPPRDRARRPGREGHPAGHASPRRSSPTPSASSPTSWNRTARRRWPRSAAACWRSWTPACR